MDLSKIKSIPTQESIKKEQKTREALKYLSDTDWYVMRLVEIGKAIPEDIAAKRAEARTTISGETEAP
ncbi:hypothetical protein BK645_14795 [Pseudomonas protegens]|uniref:hypothetical protein n=2 Tax=Pseudomonas protegens TaxID=380021 RepID=UPI0002F4A7AF|nr:hypothetical protein [Pseudomonas protegens]ROM30182.1 hypothetical protein BK645_14795 [Pseudomonas protegens]ROM37816.1 hypothetical protein BK646_22845 [Pseudomonas protegens]